MTEAPKVIRDLVARFEEHIEAYKSGNYNETQLRRETFYDFHVHRATERYQAEGMKEDFFAETTDDYATFEQALDKMIIDHFEPLAESATIDDNQMILFDSGEE